MLQHHRDVTPPTAEVQFGVWIRVPFLGLNQRLDLEEAAQAIGTYVTTERIYDSEAWLRFGFRTEAAAARFRARAREICDDLVVPGEPAA